METLKELLQLARDNWPVIKDILAIAGGVASALYSLAVVTGLRRAVKERRQARRVRREHDRIITERQARQRAVWFAEVCGKSPCCNENSKRTVQEMCGLLKIPIPEWATDGWERVAMEDLNKRVYKV